MEMKINTYRRLEFGCVFNYIFKKKKKESENSVAATNKPILIVNSFSRRWN